MTIKKKNNKQDLSQLEYNIESVIERGGKIAIDNEKTKEFRLTLRGPQDLLQMVDTLRKNKLGKVSRNQWILEAIQDKLKN